MRPRSSIFLTGVCDLKCQSFLTLETRRLTEVVLPIGPSGSVGDRRGDDTLGPKDVDFPLRRPW